MSKLFQFNEEALRSCLNGVKTIAKAVKVTLGPKGRNVVILQGFGSPLSTKDGVTVAKEIILKDKFENMAAQLIKEASSKTNDMTGDGTTTAVVLSEAIFTLGIKNVLAGSNPMDIKRGIDEAVSCVIKRLDELAKPVDSEEEIFQIATISANNDKEIGQIIASAMAKVGKEGTITVAESQGVETSLDLVEGLRFDKGYLSSYFVTSAEKMMVELDNPFILVTDQKISNAKDLIPILELIHEKQKSLLIIAEDVDNDALTTLVLNKIKAGLSVCAVKAPAFGDKRKAILQDIATLVGASLVSDELDLKLSGVTFEHLGRCKKVTVSKEETTLIGGMGDKEKINQRISQLKTQIKLTDSDYDKKAFEERLSKLTGGVAILHIGAVTESELKEKKARVEDALHATKAAVLGGIVSGGGVALIRASKAIDELQLKGDEKIGADIIKQACFAPAIAIATNCGKIGELVAEKIGEAQGSYGYHGLKDTFCDLFEEGVVDPVLVTKSALKNAASISSLLLTAACLITEKPKPKESSPGPSMGGMGGYDGMDMM